MIVIEWRNSVVGRFYWDTLQNHTTSATMQISWLCSILNCNAFQEYLSCFTAYCDSYLTSRVQVNDTMIEHCCNYYFVQDDLFQVHSSVVNWGQRHQARHHLGYTYDFIIMWCYPLHVPVWNCKLVAYLLHSYWILWIFFIVLSFIVCMDVLVT